MKILDRYILKEFFLPFFYCSSAFFLLYLIADLFEHMDEFMKAGVQWKNILLYYGYLIPTIFLQTVSFSLVLSLIYELGNFARHLEITGMKALGISPKRISAPFLCLGLILSFLYISLSEFVLPKTNFRIEELTKLYFEKSSKAKASSHIHTDITYSNIKENYVFYIRELDLKGNLARDIQVHYLSPQGAIKKVMRAEVGRWLDHEWWLLNGTIVNYDETGETEEDFQKFMKRLVDIQESPKDLIKEEKASLQMNFREYKTSLEKKFGKNIPPIQRVELFSKISTPWICFVLSLIIVPLGLNIPKGGAFVVLGKTVLVTLAFYSVQFVSLALGKQGHIHPLLAPWLANAIFMGVGGILWGRLR